MSTTTPQETHPTFTNAHAQMCAVISAVINCWGEPGEILLRSTYRRLGHHTGAQMISTGVAALDSDLESYGKVSEQIMDTCGLEGWTRIDSGLPEHRTVVPGCAAYKPLFEHLDAPANICAIPFEWDNGCLDAINPKLEIWPSGCAYSEGGSCHYVISEREHPGTRPDTVTDASTRGVDAPVAVEDEPTWTNPTAGLLALIGATVATYGEDGERVLQAALGDLGLTAGREEAPRASGQREIVGLLADRYRAGGFTGTAFTEGADGFRVELGRNPYGPVLDEFSSHQIASKLYATYDSAWADGVGSNVSVATLNDSWSSGDAEHVLAVSFH